MSKLLENEFLTCNECCIKLKDLTFCKKLNSKGSRCCVVICKNCEYCEDCYGSINLWKQTIKKYQNNPNLENSNEKIEYYKILLKKDYGVDI